MYSESMMNKELSLKAGRRLARCKPGEEVVISGIAGVFPDSNDVRHLSENLFNKVDLVSGDDRRWKLEHPEIPQRTGKLNVVNKFDAAFFGVHYKQAQTMDPMSRMLLEKAYEAIVDAGFNPKHFRGTRTGVFIGACFSESEKTWFYEKIQIDGFGITGCSRAMLANRISYWLGVNGPSYTVDSACSSSLYALEHAYRSIRDGFCETALVGGCNLCLHPYVSLQFARLGVLAPDGRCKCFDESANGYCRSETICVILLQKAKDAHRIYARVVHAKTNCDGYKEQGITYPSGAMQQKLLKDFYEECEIDPSTLDYIEAHGTGTRVGDPEEVKALDVVFCPGRKEPLRIGSIKSNIGHSEPASGLCSVSKVVIAMESGVIPPNINLKTLRKDVEAFQQERITVLTELTPWNGGLVGVNSFGFGGANCHVLLASNKKDKVNNGLPADDMPRLVCFSGRTEEAVKVILNELESKPVDVELVRLLHNVYSDEISGHVYRGYALLKKDGTPVAKSVEYFPGTKRAVWFVFAGMGSQWLTMGKTLMDIPTFARSIHRSHQILKTKGVDLIKVITTNDSKIFDNILNAFVGIAAIQIALVDILNELEIVPDGIVGHSVGELGCSYADGCFTAEQTLLAAYYRGLASLETEFIHGSMASIGLGYNTVKDELPSDIDVACHNSADNCTLSGPTESVTKYVEHLQGRGIFARRVNVSNIAYHSRYIVEAAPKLLKYLSQIVTKPKARSSKWISSSVPESEWNTEKAKYCSAEYHTNNLLSPVYFEEASRKIPPKAIVIEIGPHGLLQAILKRSLHKDIVNIPLTLRGTDNMEFLLTAVGKAYLAGINTKLYKIYPTVEFPVSRGTPMISPLVRWEHGEDWHVTSYKMQEKIKSGERTVAISLKDDEWEYVAGHIIDGRNLYPATGYLMLAWETVALMRGEIYLEVPIVFENVRFNRATNLPKEGVVEFIVMVQKGSGNFEVVEGGAAVVTGRLYVPEDVDKEMVNVPDLEEPVGDEDPNGLPLSDKDIYKELRLRGYNYKGLFKCISRANNEGTIGRVRWVNNFVAFMDNMLQMQILNEDTRSLYVPTAINKLVINTKKHYKILSSLSNENPEFPVYVYKDIQLIRSGGIECRYLKASPIARKKPLGDPVLEKYIFVPNVNIQEFTFDEIIRVSINIALENLPSTKVKTLELLDGLVKQDGPLVSTAIVKALGDLPLIQADVIVLGNPENPLLVDIGNGIAVEEKKLPADQSALLVAVSELLNKKDLLPTALNTVKEGGFILSRESTEQKLQPELQGLSVCLDYTSENERILLMRKQPPPYKIDPIVVKITEDKFSWVSEVQKGMKELNMSKNQRLIIYSEKEPLNGIMGFFNALRKEPYTENIRCFIIMDEKAPSFNLEHPLYKSQLAKDLAVNVYKNGTWGSYRHLLLEVQQNVKTYHAYVNTLVRGDLSTLKWIEGPIDPYDCGPDSEKLMYIYYAPLNFRDVMLAIGKLSAEIISRNRIEQDCVQGFEYAGKSNNGKRYMGMLIAKTMSPLIINDMSLCWEIPDHWTLEEASTVPVVYGTAVHALISVAHMSKGDSVLIHAGSGGVGQAAINLCIHYGCDIFTTVGTQEKREFIRKTFPQIPESHIGNSRDTSFEQMVMKETGGKGVDIVLNSLAEEKLQASVRCLGCGGRFLEIGKFDLAKNNTIGMDVFLKDTSFHGVMLDSLFNADDETKLKLVYDVEKAIKSGAVKPLVRTVFDYHDVEAAFRYMAAGKHIGKVILKLRDEEEDKFAVAQVQKFDAVPRYLCHRKKSYIICGGLGGFGLELADWLVLRGATKLVLTSRSGVRSGYQSMRIRLWRSYGVKVVISLDDITTKDGVENLLKTANSLGPVSAIFNLAVVLQDATFDNQTEESFAASAGPKAVATQYLDQLSRVMCPQLEQFVVFSSVSCGHGNAGQTNYAMSNSVMEKICEYRKASGLPAVAIEWGAVGEVGLVADMAEDNVDIVIGGTLQQRIASCLEVMDYLLRQPNAIVGSMVVAEKRSGGSGGGTIVDTVVNILGLRDLKTVSLHSTLAELGMDSMMAVEIKQSLEREFEVFLTPQDIRSLTFAKLYEIAASVEDEAKNPKQATTLTEMPQVGMDYFLRSVADETIASLPIMRIPTLTGGACVAEVPVTEVPTVFVIPGIEGNAIIMEPLAANLEMQVLCLQFGFEDPKNTIMGIASDIYPHIRNRLSAGQPFNVIGYSYGGVIAMEVVRMLEKEGYHGHLCLIDSSPEFLITLTRLVFYDEATKTDNDLEIKLLLHYLNLIWPHVCSELRDDLLKTKTWNERLDLVMSFAPEEGVNHTKRYQRLLMNATYLRLKALLSESDRERPLISTTQVVLIRPMDMSIPSADDYGLSKYFKLPIQTHFVEGNHFTILENKKTASIISSVFQIKTRSQLEKYITTRD